MNTDAQTTNDALLVNAGQAAKMLCVGQRTLWTLTHERLELGFIMVGRKKLYEVEELKRWIQSRKQSGPSTCSFLGRADNS